MCTSILPLCGFWGLNSGHQACLQVSFPSESSRQPTGVICRIGLQNRLPRSFRIPEEPLRPHPVSFFLPWVTSPHLPKPDIPIHSLQPVSPRPGTAGLQGPSGPAPGLPHNGLPPGQRKSLYCLGPLLAPNYRQERLKDYGEAQRAIQGPPQKEGLGPGRKGRRQ